jgi:hypothetical protein
MNEPDYPGIDGFLGTRASFMLDVLAVAMIAIVLVLAWSIYQVRYRQRYQLHKWVQVALAAVLLVTVVLFEIDIRLHGWQTRASGGVGGEPAALVWYALYIHLAFAVTTIILWPIVVLLALRSFPSPPMPAQHSRIHVPLARTAAMGMLLTAVTGWVFYWLAFVR